MSSVYSSEGTQNTREADTLYLQSKKYASTIMRCPSHDILKMVQLVILVTFMMQTTTSASNSNRSTIKYQYGDVSIQNCSCHFFVQPLDHFSGKHNKTFQQRYCVYDKFSNYHNKSSSNDTSPIFFYTGNESPLEVYINNTGIMWTLGSKYHALLVFAEHRYEGKSTPIFLPEDELSSSCMSYCTSSQALADFVTLLGRVLNPDHKRPVVAFGGSYGGMLAAWMRIKYPFAVAGAVSSSAPIWGLPLTNPIIDGASMAITNSVLDSTRSAPINPNKQEKNYCFENLLASWPLITALLSTEFGRHKISHIFHLCQPLLSTNETDEFLLWLQSPWFFLAEGNYPFESNYIPYALLNRTDAFLPAWPINEACKYLNFDFGISIKGNISEVTFGVVAKNGATVLYVDWDKIVFADQHSLIVDWRGSGVEQLLVALFNAASTWFNVTKEDSCFAWKKAFKNPEQSSRSLLSSFLRKYHQSKRSETIGFSSTLPLSPRNLQQEGINKDELQHSALTATSEACNQKIVSDGCWNSVCCNEGMHLAIVEGIGMGHDFFWPPNYPRGTTIQDLIHGQYCQLDATCQNSEFYPQTPDPSSKWLDDYYGGLRIGMITNTVFSNGLFDPWSAAGVYKISPFSKKYIHHKPSSNVLASDAVVQNITKDSSVISIILPKGAHHLDLMFPSENDPTCVIQARHIQENYIVQWISWWKEKNWCVGESCPN
jgi:pimeloyl-ACP methyl ester carboxylesterase